MKDDGIWRERLFSNIVAVSFWVMCGILVTGIIATLLGIVNS